MSIRVRNSPMLPTAVLPHDYQVSTMFSFVFLGLFLELSHFLGKSGPK